MLPLMRHLGVLAFGRVRPTTQRVMRSVIGGLIAGIFGVTAYIALLLALGMYLSQEFGPIAAALIIALATAFVAVFILAVVAAVNRRAERRLEAERRAARARLPDPVTLQLLAGLPALMRGKSLLTTVAIAAVVFALARGQGGGSEDTRSEQDG